MRWSPDHLRLHRSLLRQPDLLPRGAPLLLAVSGGQDSMAMTGLLRDLQPHHQWSLQLWHGDHGWRPESARQAAELQAWADTQRLPLRVERAEPSHVRDNREASARHWRYTCLLREAQRLGCRHVLTAHTASDRAETVLLHLARGTHRSGLAGLRRRLPLEGLLAAGAQSRPGSWGGDPAAMVLGDDDAAPQRPAAGAPGDPPLAPLWLVRPLQLFCRQDTHRICRREGWPIWLDPSNDGLALSRNRIRARVLPVLEELHPGASRRISEQAERLAAEQDQLQELLDLALMPLRSGPFQLDRRALLQLSAASQGQLLQHWLRRCRGQGIESRALASLLARLPMERGPGRLDLAGDWQLSWRGTTLALRSPLSEPRGHG